jgi:hypothetical protein
MRSEWWRWGQKQKQETDPFGCAPSSKRELTVPRYFTEQQARDMLDPVSVIAALQRIFTAQAEGRIRNLPRTRTPVFEKSLNVMAATDANTNRYAVKVYGAGTFHILLYSRTEGLLAIMEADWLGQLRTGGTNALAASVMARPASRKVGLIGAGRQAVAQLLCLEAQGLMQELHVFARQSAKGGVFCEKMSKMLKSGIHHSNEAQDAVGQADIIVTATTSSTPVVKREWLPMGVHINAMGANSANRMELDPAIIMDADILATDDVDQARKEAGEFITLGQEFDWDRVLPLHQLVWRGASPRDPAALSVFKSLGAGLEDLAIASLLYDRSKGVGDS